MISLKGLSKTYASGVEALKNLNLEIGEGEIFGFLGSNGAGKSTTIKILTTLSRPTAGTFAIAGIDPLVNPTRVRENIGYVAQEAGVDYFLSGRENLTLQGRLYHLPSSLIRERVDELLELFDLKEVADAMVSSYSGGMQRKLDVATALVHRPKILFLDEPTLGLDPRSRLTLWDYIRNLNKNFGMTIFLTTHYLEEAEKLAGRIGILEGGELKVIGTPEKLKSEMGGDSINFVCESAEKRELQTEKWNHFKFKPYIDHLVFDRNEVRMYVRNGKDALLKVMAEAEAIKLEVETISFSRASLDDVFLKYTGKSLENKKEETEAEPWWKKWQKSGQGNDEWKKWQKTNEEGSSDEQDGEKSSISAGKQGSDSASPDVGSGGIEGAIAPSGPADEVARDASPSKNGFTSEQREREGEAPAGSAGGGGDASPSKSSWQSGKWTEAEMKEWWANKSKTK
ncbi:MAG: ATP-binding cassette domain-containing protein [Nitrospirae bacterium]|nr:ATP-binding cassette domain-containing protein [Nitrospirota bacterium]MBI3594151.1 ATP-binding cassette domain-containing protein [Nitrospirota bacterium]